MRSRSVLLWGALAGALLTAPLMALLYLAYQIGDIPFAPYDAFEWISRVLPGKIVIHTIETMVKLINKLDLGATDTTAKTLEKLMALATFFGGGVVAGVVLFVLMGRFARNLQGLARWIPGLLAGVVMGLPMLLITWYLKYHDNNAFVQIASQGTTYVWYTVAFLAWGIALAWAYYSLFPVPVYDQPARLGEPVRFQPINRRQFMILVGGATATLTLIGAGLGSFLNQRQEDEYNARIRRNRAAAMPVGLPNANDPVQPAPGTRPEYTPLEDHYRIDISLDPPVIDGETWRLNLGGMVDHPLSLRLDEIKDGYTPLEQFVTLACISNPVGGDLTSTTRWTGARLKNILADAGVQDGATHIKITAADGFYETVALDFINSDDRVMLAYHWDGIDLLTKHGYPLRIYLPDHYGMKQPKWITDIEVMDHDEDGYWVERGWDKEARMLATSVVDVVATDSIIDQNGQQLVPIGGIAHAGARGISKVEVKVDGGDWMEAQLRAPLSETTWVIWRYDWPFQSGEHTFAVRCYEGDGTPQIEDRAGNYPSGATGINSMTRDI